MMRKLDALLLATALSLAACTGSGRTDASAQANPPSTTGPAMDSRPAAQSPVVALERVVRRGMAYADFRSEAIASGWTPVPDPECKANVVGGDYLVVCASEPHPAACDVCDALPELDSYSGDAKTLSVFRNSAQGLRMEVIGVGELADWNVLGEDSGLQILEWNITPDRTE